MGGFLTTYARGARYRFLVARGDPSQMGGFLTTCARGARYRFLVARGDPSQMGDSLRLPFKERKDFQYTTAKGHSQPDFLNRLCIWSMIHLPCKDT